MLPPTDTEFLVQREIVYELHQEGGILCVLVPDWPLPPGYTIDRSTLLIRLNPGYPDVPPDMWWFDPPVAREDGDPIPQTQSMETYLGRSWQRWSRHLDPGHWTAGIDGLESYFALIRADLLRHSGRA